MTTPDPLYKITGECAGADWSVEIDRLPYGERRGVLTVRGAIIANTPALLTPHHAAVKLRMNIPRSFEKDPCYQDVRQACTKLIEHWEKPWWK